MPIGNSFDLPEYNKEENERVKVGDKVQEWWDSLDYQVQVELMEIEYPDDSNLMTVDEMWEGLDWKAKVEIYISENEKEFMSSDELYDGGVMSNFDNENERREW
ncbi:MAG: hypothetical protein PHI16_06295 [Methanocellales archaeon]|nr:hypothetical protein [Methanocellales archaeon]